MKEIIIAGLTALAVIVGAVTYSNKATTFKWNVELKTAEKIDDARVQKWQLRGTSGQPKCMKHRAGIEVQHHHVHAELDHVSVEVRSAQISYNRLNKLR